MINSNQRFVFMDYETTGVDTNIRTNVRPIEIGCVFTDNELNVLKEYESLIKWDSIIHQTEWYKETATDGSYSQYDTSKVHKIELDDLRKHGKWPHEVENDLREIISDIQIGNRKPTIISDAPNFEMFWTQFLFGPVSPEKFPFHYNAWSIYPVLQMFNIDMPISEDHRSLSDARSMHRAMQAVFAASREYNIFRNKAL